MFNDEIPFHNFELKIRDIVCFKRIQIILDIENNETHFLFKNVFHSLYIQQCFISLQCVKNDSLKLLFINFCKGNKLLTVNVFILDGKETIFLRSLL